MAAVNSTTLADGAVLDLGGGSLQLVETVGRHAGRMGSWPLGAVRMTERFLAGDDPPSKKDIKALRAHVAETLMEASWLKGTGRRLVGIGGTIRNLAAAAQAEAGLPSLGVQGYVIDAMRARGAHRAPRRAARRRAQQGQGHQVRAGPTSSSPARSSCSR